MKNKALSFAPYIVIFVISLCFFGLSLGVNGDEIWNYNFARNIYNGLRPYSDFNMVQTPLSAY